MSPKQPHERLRPLIRSDLWGTLEGYLKERQATLMNRIVKCPPEELKEIQGAYSEVDYLLNLKETLNAEEKSRG